MKHARLAALLLAAGIALCGAGAARGQSLDDFFIGPDFYPDTETVVDLQATPNDRFIVALRSKSLRYLDTWDFEPVAGAGGITTLYTGDTTGVSLSVSPDGNYVFVGGSDGKITTVNIFPLYNTFPHVGLSTSLVKSTTGVSAGNSLTPLAAVPEWDGGSTVYVLSGGRDAFASHLYWAPFQNGQMSAASSLFDFQAAGLASGNNLGAWIYKTVPAPTSQYLFQVIQCYARTVPCLATNVPLLLSSTETFQGLAFDRIYDEYAVTLNDTQGEIWAIDTDNPVSVAVSDTLPTPAANDLEILSTGSIQPIAGCSCEVVVTAPESGPSITLSGINYKTVTFSGDTAHIAGTAHYTDLAASTYQDGYVYAAGSNAVQAVTANPWIVEAGPLSGLTIIDGLTVTAGFTVAVAVYSHSLVMDILLSPDLVFKDWSASIGTVTGFTVVGDTTGFLIHGSVSDLPTECENLLTMVAGDTFQRQGRAAFTVSRDTFPEAQSFGLGFGDKRLIYNLTALNLCDLASLEVWYHTSPAGITVYADLAALGAVHYDTYTAPAAGDKIEDSIEGLVNLTTYYVWVVTIDQSGHQTIGAPQSGIPQQTYTLTDLTDEDGGVNCFGSVVRSEPGSGWGMALLTMPLVIGGGMRWWKRRWGR